MKTNNNPVLFKSLFQALLYLIFSCILAACASGKEKSPGNLKVADTLLINGKIYTARTDVPWADAIAIKGKNIIFVGNNVDAQRYRGTATWVIDLDGKMAMPGLNDGHVHPILGGMELATQCLFPATATPQTVRATISQCINNSPKGSWIVGGRWNSAFFRNYQITSPAKWLDAFTGNYPVSLADDTGHNRWVNSKALVLAGIDSDTQISAGRIGLEADGVPNGLLYESAMMPVLAAINRDRQPSAAQYLEAARTSLNKAIEFGITGIKEAGDAHEGVVAYRKLDQAGELNVHITACIAVQETPDGKLDITELQGIREENRTRHVDTNCAKIFLDGVPSEARTAAMVENYLPDAEGHIHSGELLLSPDKLKEYVTRLDAMGMTVKMHVAGDRSVHVALDAIENARRINGNSGLRHELAHSGFIHPADIQRFVDLNAVADMSPSIWYPSPIVDSIIAALGKRGEHYWPFKDLLNAGVEVIAGTDWPAVVDDMNPWPGIESMVTRQHPDNSYEGSLWPEQAITLSQALQIYTINGARALNLSNVTGSLEPGKRADVIVLNQNIFAIPANYISDTRVEMTFFEGNLVYQRNNNPPAKDLK